MRTRMLNMLRKYAFDVRSFLPFDCTMRWDELNVVSYSITVKYGMYEKTFYITYDDMLFLPADEMAKAITEDVAQSYVYYKNETF